MKFSLKVRSLSLGGSEFFAQLKWLAIKGVVGKPICLINTRGRHFLLWSIWYLSSQYLYLLFIYIFLSPSCIMEPHCLALIISISNIKFQLLDMVITNKIGCTLESVLWLSKIWTAYAACLAWHQGYVSLDRCL